MKGNFQNIISGDRPVLIDFFAEWCGPCKAQAPILNEIARETNNKLRIIKIDIDKNQALAQKYNVRSVPTLMFFDKGKKVWQKAGMQTKVQLLKAVETYI